MFFILSKILDFLISPIVWILIVSFLGVITKNPKRKRYYIITGFVLLLLFTNPFVVNCLIAAWEKDPFTISELNQSYDVGIVMGGASRYFDKKTQRLVFGNGVDRILQAAELYRQKKIKKILLTGGSGFVFSQQVKEADLLKDLLVKMHIPDTDIILERKSRNTFENALMSAEMLRTKKYGDRFLIITSAIHIRRTSACFAKQGITADVFPVDQHSGNNVYTPDKLFQPDAGALSNWDMLIHECTGMFVYKLSGYI